MEEKKTEVKKSLQTPQSPQNNTSVCECVDDFSINKSLKPRVPVYHVALTFPCFCFDDFYKFCRRSEIRIDFLERCEGGEDIES